ncbi:hypothetical protein BDV93DRAFT_457775, partial [Ceratobasidium sp. AG-I]
KVMFSLPVHDLPNPVRLFEEHRSSFQSKHECWADVSNWYCESQFDEITGIDTRHMIEAISIAYMRLDLRTCTALVYNVSATTSWKYRGWLPWSWQIHTMRWLSRFGFSGW